MSFVHYDEIKELIFAREERALKQLENDLRYQQICIRQQNTNAHIEELYQIFSKEDRRMIRRHYEGELEREDCELRALYLQGLRDCFKLLSFLSQSTD